MIISLPTDKELSTHTILYCFFAPSVLSEADEKNLSYFENKEPKYVEGVQQGWSVLILGNTNLAITEPGVVKKSSLLKKIDQYFWDMHQDSKFYFPDGTLVTKKYIDSLE